MGEFMTPEHFVEVLEAWRATGGIFPEDIPYNHKITTKLEAGALCHAIVHGDIYGVNDIQSPALHRLVGFFQEVEAREVSEFLREKGLPLLRQILVEGLDQELERDSGDWAVAQRRDTYVYLTKILALYEQPADVSLIVRAIRNPALSENHLWSIVFDIIGERGRNAVQICNKLIDPLPDGFVGVSYLDFANFMMLSRKMSHHPFNTEIGVARLAAHLVDRDPNKYSYARSSASCIPFISPPAREVLLDHANKHPDVLVRLEAAWAHAKGGSEVGRQSLAHFCADPRLAKRAATYLEELGYSRLAQLTTRNPDFQALAEMCDWLTHPNEFGRPPDDVWLYDTRELNWPPTGDRRRLWLVKYRFKPQREGEQIDEGVGLVGSVTFALGAETVNLSPEDLYALHCCWELNFLQDPNAPDDVSSVEGRRILGAANPDFPPADQIPLFNHPGGGNCSQ